MRLIIALSFVPLIVGAQVPDSTPPLRPGEYWATTRDGCFRIFALPANAAPDFVQGRRSTERRSNERGYCQNRLATGKWSVANNNPQHFAWNYAYGRMLTRTETQVGLQGQVNFNFRLGD